jgi:glycosyltransferase involved in cell wall biosynthesis
VTNDPNPVVSVIVPARNEEANLAACLESLVAQTGIDYEIIVVDDDSTDRTAEIARSFVSTIGKGTTFGSTAHVAAGVHARRAVTVISAPPLPANWTGKNNAMSAGAKIAKGKWLLFTDADTVHKPGSLARAIAEAAEHGAALLSYSPEQEIHSLWEKAVMPVIFAELATTYPPQAVNDPASPIAAANGQYLMISREAYDAVGGHAKIADNLLEDVAMARLIKSSGREIFFRYGGDAVRTRMYRSFAQMKEGWTKNLALLFPEPGQLAQRRFGEFVLLLALPWLVRPSYWRVVSSLLPPLWFECYVVILGVWACAAFILTVVKFLSRMGKAHFSRGTVAGAFFGLPIFAYLLLRSQRSYKKSQFDWKDRTYVYNPDELATLRGKETAAEGSMWAKLKMWISGLSHT